MPGGDKTGPMGMGRMTGRGAGYCTGYANPLGFAGGFGRSFGRGLGFRRTFCANGLPGWAHFEYPVDAEANGEASNEKEFLNSRAEFLEKQLQQVKKRLSRLKEDDE